ncbi:hypothetical protein C8Q76DRAFT_792676 [Earliella scabrosa]|nr:hypothetical protein C8Q76DRAFT_792676 [Earliella scabrosa]
MNSKPISSNLITSITSSTVMPASEDLIRDWDAIAESLGPTPVYDPTTGEIVPLGQREGRSSGYYTVWDGRAVGIYCNWGLAHSLVNSFPGSSYKWYKTLEQARLGWAQGPTGRPGWVPPRPGPARPTPGVSRPSADDYEPPSTVSNLEGPTGAPAATAEPRIPPEIEVLPRAPVRVFVPAAIAASESSEDNEQYWHDATDYIPDAAIASADIVPLSPTISSVSTLSLSPSPSLLSGTISPRTINTPDMQPLSAPSTPRPISRTLSCPTPRDSSPRPISRRARGGSPTKPTLSAASQAHPSSDSSAAKPTPTKATRSAKKTGNNFAVPSGSSVIAPARDAAVAVPKPSHFYVVVRGDYPGIYFDRNVALLKIGTSPGMKLVVFQSLSHASWYFVKQFMAGQVGVPVLVVNDE